MQELNLQEQPLLNQILFSRKVDRANIINFDLMDLLKQLLERNQDLSRAQRHLILYSVPQVLNLKWDYLLFDQTQLLGLVQSCQIKVHQLLQDTNVNQVPKRNKSVNPGRGRKRRKNPAPTLNASNNALQDNNDDKIAEEIMKVSTTRSSRHQSTIPLARYDDITKNSNHDSVFARSMYNQFNLDDHGLLTDYVNLSSQEYNSEMSMYSQRKNNNMGFNNMTYNDYDNNNESDLQNNIYDDNNNSIANVSINDGNNVKNNLIGIIKEIPIEETDQENKDSVINDQNKLKDEGELSLRKKHFKQDRNRDNILKPTDSLNSLKSFDLFSQTQINKNIIDQGKISQDRTNIISAFTNQLKREYEQDYILLNEPIEEKQSSLGRPTTVRPTSQLGYEMQDLFTHKMVEDDNEGYNAAFDTVDHENQDIGYDNNEFTLDNDNNNHNMILNNANQNNNNLKNNQNKNQKQDRNYNQKTNTNLNTNQNHTNIALYNYEDEESNDRTKIKPNLGNEYLVQRTANYINDTDFLKKLEGKELKLASSLAKSMQPNQEYILENVLSKAYQKVDKSQQRIQAATSFQETLVMASKSEINFRYKPNTEQYLIKLVV